MPQDEAKSLIGIVVLVALGFVCIGTVEQLPSDGGNAPSGAAAEFDALEGVCAPQPGRSLDDWRGYDEIATVTGLGACAQVCSDVRECVAFTLVGAAARCRITTACPQLDRRVGYLTYMRLSARHDPADTGRPGTVPTQRRSDKPPRRAVQEPSRSRKAAPTVFDDGCSYCPVQRDCEEPRMCRTGRCFRGLAADDGLPCLGSGRGSSECQGGDCVELQEDVDSAPAPWTKRAGHPPS